MRNLFSDNIKKRQPLAYGVRPKKIEEFVGQEDVVGENSILRKLLKENQIINCIFFGPPGTGKTTMAHLISEELEYNFKKLNATTANLNDFRNVVEEAKRKSELDDQGTILFLDEIHRFNKLQQDSLLPYTEDGTLILVGATTENPYYNLNNALLSRCLVFEFKGLSKGDIKKVLSHALNKRGKALDIDIQDTIAELTPGDARIALNYLELALKLKERLSKEELKKSLLKRKLSYHKVEDKYNLISAFIKSIRGSDPDAAIYWLGRLLQGGEDPRYVARRLVIHASEDIGLANPEAMLIATAALTSSERIGMPEIRIILAEATLYLAISTKSNSSQMAIDSVMAELDSGVIEEVPRHLAKLYNQEYKYPHSCENNFVKQEYKYGNTKYYKPGKNKNELLIAKHLKKLWE